MNDKQNYESKFYAANLCSSHKGWDDMLALFREADKEIAELKETIDSLLTKSRKLTGRGE